ncbi:MULTISPECIES: metalloregulator ArsR/SmtB family transcription factor [Pseudomonas]|jgi:predicted ArsR family transcriptional regulator|uniref:Putative triosephosphate isomerase n=1 Tax=Pseudomonas wadenswilerensis TaxID=1785161 RepID=A0A380T0P4_9PSED|nr:MULTISPECIES: metalloregulator ArsR/SmtB family transcription factor [Pseudomonas]SPO66284.1 MarR family protein [Pseudomonas sp. JV241A]SUQ63862.1 putative triosephosphate isomerase [Pseudomonas wadenswilerensis]
MTAPAADASSTADRILFLLKTRGALKTTDLASLLDITFEAARQQIQKLQSAELITGISAPAKGAGRPSQKWTLTEAAQRRFPDSHSVLTLQLIETVEQVFGHEGVDQLITRMETANRSEYLQACSLAETIEDKVRVLVQLRERAGYMAEMVESDNGWLIIENHCPICVAASRCQGFCRSELQIFQSVFGEQALVERCEHLISGDRRCVYRVSPRTAPAQ